MSRFLPSESPLSRKNSSAYWNGERIKTRHRPKELVQAPSAVMLLRASFLSGAVSLPPPLAPLFVGLSRASVFICLPCWRQAGSSRGGEQPAVEDWVAFPAELYSPGQRPAREAAGLQQQRETWGQADLMESSRSFLLFFYYALESSTSRDQNSDELFKICVCCVMSWF